MRVRLKGLNKATKKKADGTCVTYYYAWRGGPLLKGEIGSPEFMASYNEAVSRRREPAAGTIQAILNAFQMTTIWSDLAERTKKDYIRLIKIIEKDFGDFPISALTDRRTRSIFLEWRDRRAATSRRQADYAWQVLARILSWAYGNGLTTINPCERGGRVYRGNRSEMVWTQSDEESFLAGAPKHLHLALILALWTGQRQGDLLDLTWSNYDGEKIRLKQSKTGMRVNIPAGGPLKALLDARKSENGHILLTMDGQPWTADGFRSSWRKACLKVGIDGITFNDLRGTAVTRLALAGCTEAEIATITGHSLRDVRSILDAHYLHRDPKLAESAIKKLENKTNFSN